MRVKKHKKILNSAVLCLSTVFSANAMADNDNPKDGITGGIEINYMQEDIAGWKSTPLSKVEGIINFTPYVSAKFGADYKKNVFSQDNEESGDIGTASLLLNTGKGSSLWRNNWDIEVGMLGRQPLFEGAFGRKKDSFSTPLSAAEPFLIEELNNLVGARIKKTINISNNWRWTTSVVVGQTQNKPEALQYKDAFDFIFDNDINTAPRLRKEMQKVWSDIVSNIDSEDIANYYPDIEADGNEVIDNIPDEDLKEFFEKLIRTAGPYFPEYTQEMSRKEFAGAVAGSALDYQELGQQVVSNLWGVLRQSQANSNKKSVLLRTEFARETKTGCFTFGTEGGKIYSDGVGDVDETHAGVYLNACKKITSNIEWSGAVEVAGFRNYLNLKDVDNAIGVAYTQVAWKPEKLKKLELHYGAGKSYSALFGEAVHQEIGAKYDFMKTKQTIVSGYANYGKIDSKPTLLGYNTLLGRDNDKASNIGVRIRYKF